MQTAYRRSSPRKIILPCLALLTAFLSAETGARSQSIWDDENLISDRRIKVHDLITIIIDEQSETRTKGSHKAQKNSQRDLDLIDFFGMRGRGFQEGNSSTRPAIRYRFGSTRDKEGEITHKEDFKARITGRVVEVLPNGNLVFEAKKSIRIGEEESVIVFSGEVRPQDISEDNTIHSYYVADARIEYRGRGAVTDAIRRGWLTRLFDFANVF